MFTRLSIRIHPEIKQRAGSNRSAGRQASKLGLDRIAKQKRLEKEMTKGPETVVKRCEKHLKTMETTWQICKTTQDLARQLKSSRTEIY